MRKTKILFLAANPSNETRLALSAEVKQIKRYLRSASFRGRVSFVQEWDVTLRDLQTHLMEHKPEIVHFSGHGSAEGQLLFMDARGSSTFAEPPVLAQVFRILRLKIRCVVLNACYSLQQAEEISKHIDLVIGMSSALGDRTAIEFSNSFYEAVANGLSARSAFDLARNNLDLTGISTGEQPQLLTRAGIDPSKIYFVRLPPANAQPKRIRGHHKAGHSQSLPQPRTVSETTISIEQLVELLERRTKERERIGTDLEQYRRLNEDARAVAMQIRDRVVHPTIGSILGRFKLARLIGTGLFGTVWEARNLSDGTTAAIKCFDLNRLETGLMLWRFRRSVSALRELNEKAPSSAIVKVLASGPLWFAMTYYTKGTLENVSLFGWSLAQKLARFRKICEAVRDAHRQRIIHRDIKPANVMLDESFQPVLIDWDLVYLPWTVAEEAPKFALGTPLFADPILLGADSTDNKQDSTSTAMRWLNANESSDIFSLGRLLHYLLLERPPSFQSNETTIGEQLSSVSMPLAEVVIRATNANPGKRYSSVDELLDDLSKMSSRIAKVHAILQSSTRKVKRNRGLFVVVSTVILALSGLLVQESRYASLYSALNAKSFGYFKELEAYLQEGDLLMAKRSDASAEARAELDAQINEYLARGKNLKRELAEHTNEISAELDIGESSVTTVARAHNSAKPTQSTLSALVPEFKKRVLPNTPATPPPNLQEEPDDTTILLEEDSELDDTQIIYVSESEARPRTATEITKIDSLSQARTEKPRAHHNRRRQPTDRDIRKKLLTTAGKIRECLGIRAGESVQLEVDIAKSGEFRALIPVSKSFHKLQRKCLTTFVKGGALSLEETFQEAHNSIVQITL